jgi:hypothetical protein
MRDMQITFKDGLCPKPGDAEFYTPEERAEMGWYKNISHLLFNPESLSSQIRCVQGKIISWAYLKDLNVYAVRRERGCAIL